MNYHSDDELDRALFAMPLEEPPAGLRASILASTVYRPSLPATPFKLWEAWTLGAIIAVMVWAGFLVAGGAANTIIASFTSLSASAFDAITQPATLLWIAVGGAASFWISQATFISLPVPQRRTSR
ncbi:MAG TPA: hypothetical protein VIG32_04295 [Candidatus Baltobacteraceae bacterium]|jgi:hypothetical protein